MEMPSPVRGLFCNRTLNLRSIRAIGFDMDYTLIHYRTEYWEQRAFEYMRDRLVADGYPVQDLTFDPETVQLGLILDLEHGNVVKANRFGYIKRAAHGTQMLSYEAQRDLYARDLVDLKEPRWVFMNTLFSLSEASMYLQMVDLLDADALNRTKGKAVHGYQELYKIVRMHMDETHMEGKLKAEIVANPAPFVAVDKELPLSLLDLKHAGKTLMLITNSEWEYTQPMMSWVFDKELPGEMTWRDLFDVVNVSAGKPGYFTGRGQLLEIVDDSGLMRPARELEQGKAYFGGHAGLVERFVGGRGDDILYVGDHIFADVNVSKSLLRWRTALVVRELEDELQALEDFQPKQAQLSAMMDRKNLLEHEFSSLRIKLQRIEFGYGEAIEASGESLKSQMQQLRSQLVALDSDISELAREAGQLVNPRWGLLMRAGNDKSHLARQVERYADIYMSRVSNLLAYTPFVFLRSPRGSLPHDSGPAGGPTAFPTSG